MCLKRILLIAGSSFAIISVPSTAQERYFTVRDSIEMATFIDPETRFGWGLDAQVKLSPDQKRFAVVTTRGTLQSDEIEASLWVFNSEEVRNALLSHDTRAVVPKVVARVAVVTNDGA